MKVPDHLKGFATPIAQLAPVLPGELGTNYVGCRLSCTCGNDKGFTVRKNDRPFVLAKCTSCGKMITVYDVKLYPNACVYASEGALTQVFSPSHNEVYSVLIGFEFPEPENGELYTDNDISWCHIYGCVDESSERAFLILSDETL